MDFSLFIFFQLMVILLFLTTNTKSEGRYYVSASLSSPSNISCTLAKPPLFYTGDVLTANLSGIRIEVTESIWVGYFKAITRLEYLGCASSDQIRMFYEENFNQSITARKDPGSCFFFCQNTSKYFGINDNKCYCLPNYENTSLFTETGCTMECDEKGVACGGKNYISLYRMNTQVEAKPIVSGTSCLLYERYSRKLHMRKCSEKYYFPIICYNETAVYGLSVYVSTMMDAALQCFQRHARLISYNNFNETEHYGSVWTGVMLTEAIFRDIQKSANQILHGVLRWTGREYVVEFLEFGDDIQRRSLCFEEYEETSSIETVTSIYTTAGFLTTASDIKAGLPAGLSAAVVLLVSVVVIVVMVLKRRKQKQLKKEIEIDENRQTEDVPNNYSNIMDVSPMTENDPTLYSQLDQQYNSAHTYGVIENEHQIKPCAHIKPVTGNDAMLYSQLQRHDNSAHMYGIVEKEHTVEAKTTSFKCKYDDGREQTSNNNPYVNDIVQ